MGHDTSCEPDFWGEVTCAKKVIVPAKVCIPDLHLRGPPVARSTSPKSSRAIHLGLLLFHTVAVLCSWPKNTFR